ncbi:Hypothetical_protein [Hexamita inflata]|uniref:Hypothetical_protein n=1 Tax=Hexamita inflata TaxID=28002 RepID=A0AA86R007_9EUKA|nr:Hypothetical protein HINF_LOCUS54733 [Hexamita inflata]
MLNFSCDNKNFLKINWVLDSNTENRNANTKLEIKGQPNYFAVFNQFQLICVQNVVLKNCQLNLSQIQGEFKWLHIVECKCTNEFGKCKINNFKAENTNLSINQIAKMDISSSLDINATETPEYQIDYWNLCKLNASTINISINECKIDFSMLSGNFQHVRFYKCDISGVSENFKAQTVYASDGVFQTESFECIDCSTLEYSSVNNTPLPLKSKATKKIAYYFDCCVDLDSVAGQWSYLMCSQCTLINQGNKNEVSLRQNCNSDLQLTNCDFELSVLNGSWNKIELEKCNIKTNKCQINANNVIADSVNITDFSCFTTQMLKVTNCSVTNLPKNTESTLVHCNLIFKPNMNHIRIININNCKLTKFSIIYFPKAVKICFGDKNEANINNIINKFKQSINPFTQNKTKLQKLKQQYSYGRWNCFFLFTM